MSSRVQEWPTRLLPLAAAALPAAVVALPHDWRFLPLHALVLAATLAVAWRAPLIERALRDAPLRRWGLMAATSLAVAWLLFGEAPRANWALIDDHVIHTIVGPGRDRLPTSELAARLRDHPECGSPPLTMTRYRPTYYLFYHLEAAAWGKDVRLWLLTRVVLFALTALLAFDLLRQWLGFVAGGLAVSFFAVLAVWREIATQMGPAECYAALPTLAFAWCATHILRSPAPAGAAAWTGVAASAICAIGAKENFVVLAPLCLLLGGIEWKRSRLGLAGIAACLAVTAAAACVAFVVVAGIVGNGGRDVYERAVGFSGFFRPGDKLALRAIRKLVGYGLPLLIATVWIGLVAWRQRRLWPDRRAVVPVVGLVLVLVAASQFVFYRGEVFKKCRYDLPFVPLVCLLLIGLLVHSSRRRQGGPEIRRIRRRLLVPAAVSLAAMAIGGDSSRAATHARVVASHSFCDALRRIADACRQDPARPVTFFVNPRAPARYEPVISVAEYLRSMGITNPLHLSPAGLPTADQMSAAVFTDRLLADLSANGDHLVHPWSGLPPDAAPIQVWFSAEPPAGRTDAFRVN
jgi:hypothetical protein